jgi:hypothetical protein
MAYNACMLKYFYELGRLAAFEKDAGVMNWLRGGGVMDRRVATAGGGISNWFKGLGKRMGIGLSETDKVNKYLTAHPRDNVYTARRALKMPMRYREMNMKRALDPVTAAQEQYKHTMSVMARMDPGGRASIRQGLDTVSGYAGSAPAMPSTVAARHQRILNPRGPDMPRHNIFLDPPAPKPGVWQK